MSSQHNHKRSRSRESSHQRTRSKKHKSSRANDENQQTLCTILSTLKDLKSDINSCTTRIVNLEDQFSVSGASDSLNVEHDVENIEQESDSISVLAGNDFDRPDLLHQEDLALQPPVLANQPTITAIQPPNSAIQPPNSAIQPPNSAIQPPNAACQPSSSTSNAQTEVCSLEHDSSRPITSGLYDPETSALSWSPSEEFTNFLEKHFRRNLTFDQVCDILEEQAVPSVDALVAPILDPPMLQHVAFQNKKFIQERDKELAGIQRAMLNATGPLCTLYDQLEQGNRLEPADLKLILEQTLCLLGSANTQLATLRRKKVLASINKSKIELANQPLPNAKRFLFGEDFPAIASKEAELSRGLAKNLASAPKLDKAKPSYGPRYSTSSNNSNVFPKSGKYQNFRQRQKFFRPPRFQQSQPLNSLSSSNNGKA